MSPRNTKGASITVQSDDHHDSVSAAGCHRVFDSLANTCKLAGSGRNLENVGLSARFEAILGDVRLKTSVQTFFGTGLPAPENLCHIRSIPDVSHRLAGATSY